MPQSKTVFMVALTVLLCLSLNLRATEDEDSGGKGGLHGVQEFFTSGTFTVPKHVTHVMVTMWGAGGGAGGGAANTGNTSCNFGGIGGGGTYTNTVVSVIPGETYNVNVGQGGSSTANLGENGGDGGDSQFALANTILAFASGGKGGGAATQSGNGVAGSGGQADSNAEISHPATSSAGYAINLIPVPEYPSPSGSVFSQLTQGSLGGSADCYGNITGPGANGQPGYVLLTY
jgi:hypothetical protein